MSAHAADFTDLELNEIIAEALEARRINWCRARLLHALAGAELGGVLKHVLDELVPEAPHFADEVHRVVAQALRENGWMTPGPAFDPSALSDLHLQAEIDKGCGRQPLSSTRGWCASERRGKPTSWCRACRSALELKRRRGG